MSVKSDAVRAVFGAPDVFTVRPVTFAEIDISNDVFFDQDDGYDFEDVDCKDCPVKFFIRPSDYTNGLDSKGNPPPTKCGRCRKGLPPLHEY